MFSSKMWSKERVQLRRNIKVKLSIWSIWQNYESAIEHLLAARAEMDRRTAIFDWYWRMPSNLLSRNFGWQRAT
jgi:hypothetical protein